MDALRIRRRRSGEHVTASLRSGDDRSNTNLSNHNNMNNSNYNNNSNRQLSGGGGGEAASEVDGHTLNTNHTNNTSAGTSKNIMDMFRSMTRRGRLTKHASQPSLPTGKPKASRGLFLSGGSSAANGSGKKNNNCRRGNNRKNNKKARNNKKGKKPSTSVCKSIEQKDWDNVRKLLGSRKGQNEAKAVPFTGTSVLYLSLEHGPPEDIVQDLIDVAPEVLQNPDLWGLLPLHRACFLVGKRVWSTMKPGRKSLKKCYDSISATNTAFYAVLSAHPDATVKRCRAHGRTPLLYLLLALCGYPTVIYDEDQSSEEEEEEEDEEEEEEEMQGEEGEEAQEPKQQNAIVDSNENNPDKSGECKSNNINNATNKGNNNNATNKGNNNNNNANNKGNSNNTKNNDDDDGNRDTKSESSLWQAFLRRKAPSTPLSAELLAPPPTPAATATTISPSVSASSPAPPPPPPPPQPPATSSLSIQLYTGGNNPTSSSSQDFFCTSGIDASNKTGGGESNGRKGSMNHRLTDAAPANSSKRGLSNMASTPVPRHKLDRTVSANALYDTKPRNRAQTSTTVEETFEELVLSIARGDTSHQQQYRFRMDDLQSSPTMDEEEDEMNEDDNDENYDENDYDGGLDDDSLRTDHDDNLHPSGENAEELSSYSSSPQGGPRWAFDCVVDIVMALVNIGPAAASAPGKAGESPLSTVSQALEQVMQKLHESKMDNDDDASSSSSSLSSAWDNLPNFHNRQQERFANCLKQIEQVLLANGNYHQGQHHRSNSQNQDLGRMKSALPPQHLDGFGAGGYVGGGGGGGGGNRNRAASFSNLVMAIHDIRADMKDELVGRDIVVIRHDKSPKSGGSSGSSRKDRRRSLSCG